MLLGKIGLCGCNVECLSFVSIGVIEIINILYIDIILYDVKIAIKCCIGFNQ